MGLIGLPYGGGGQVQRREIELGLMYLCVSRTAPTHIGQPSSIPPPAMDRPHSPPALPPPTDRLPPRSPSPPSLHNAYNLPPLHDYQHPPHHPRPDLAYHHREAHSRPASRVSDTRQPPPPPPSQKQSQSASSAPSVTDQVTPPASPPHKRFKSENSLPPPAPCHVDQRWHAPSRRRHVARPVNKPSV
ncbi:hypothetical protein BD309DRAFT_732536 [Dichomitus squalens]|nr:hypothetical protein BD309DRAFT_732536 [Dichomitus squalens]